jgi:hypothetical protein
VTFPFFNMAEDFLPRHQRLTNLIDVEIVPHLNFPSTPAPACASRSLLPLNLNESVVARDPQLLEQIQELLQSADASYV